MKSVQYFDGHIVINIFGLIIRIKKDFNYDCPKVNSVGINTVLDRYRPIIVSLTSFPERIHIVEKTIRTLLSQTVKPDKLILWLAEEQFPNHEGDLPQALLDLTQYGLTINWCKNIRSYKKIIPALKQYPDAIIITTDDDIYYAPDTIETLYKSYLDHPDEIQAHRCDWLNISEKEQKKSSGKEQHSSDSHLITWEKTKELFADKHRGQSSYRLRLTGYGAVLYPPNCLYKDVTDEELIARTIPTHDDIWLWAMAVLNGTKTRLVKGYSESINYVEDSQKYGLCKINKKGIGMGLSEAYNIILKEYPQIIDILKSEY